MKEIQIGKQPPTNTKHFYFKDNEVTPDFAKDLQELGVRVHTERDDDWFWDTWKERA